LLIIVFVKFFFRRTPEKTTENDVNLLEAEIQQHTSVNVLRFNGRCSRQRWYRSLHALNFNYTRN